MFLMLLLKTFEPRERNLIQSRQGAYTYIWKFAEDDKEKRTAFFIEFLRVELEYSGVI